MRIDHGMGVTGETAEIGDHCPFTKASPLEELEKRAANVIPHLRLMWWSEQAPRCWERFKIGTNTRIGADRYSPRRGCRLHGVGIPGRVIHQSGVRNNPLAHSALPDAEANVIRNLMERIDALENQNRALTALIKHISPDTLPIDLATGQSQNLQDREIVEFLGIEP